MQESIFNIVSEIRRRLTYRQLLGKALLNADLITEADLAAALEAQNLKGYRLGYHLVKAGAIDETTLSGFLAERYGVPALSADSVQLHPDLFQGLPEDFWGRHEVLPLNRAGNTITLAMADPTDRKAIRYISAKLNARVNPVVAPQSVIHKHLAHFAALKQIEARMGSGGETMAITRFFTGLRDYRFQKVLGAGGFGIACKCWQISLDRPVVVKTMRTDLTRSPELTERFKREGKIIARLTHPNIIQVFEQGEALGVLYIVMEYFDGFALDAYCKSKDLLEKISCLIPICDALDYASRAGVVHRDIKPANILANQHGEVKLLDFGVAQHRGSGDERLTRHDMIIGTPKYMAPESFLGTEECSTLTDIYAMGVIAYEMFSGAECGKPPRRGLRELNPQLPLVLEQTVQKALEPEASKRLRSFDLFKRALSLSRDQMMANQTMLAPLQPPSGARPLPLETQPSPGSKPDAAPGIQGAAPAIQGAAPPPPPARDVCVEERVLLEANGVRVAIVRNDAIKRRMVTKQLRAEMVNHEWLERLADIQHPNIVRVLSVAGVSDGVTVIQEYLEGGTLADKLNVGPVGARDFSAWAEGIVNALRTAAERGVTHGHLHPGNILFTKDGQVKVGDFGIFAPRDKTFARFARPEIREPRDLDRYALGVILFEMLTGAKYHGSWTVEANYEIVKNDRHIDSLVKVPLGRLWGIPKCGEKFRTYAEMSDHLRLLREKFNPDRSAEVSAAIIARGQGGDEEIESAEMDWLNSKWLPALAVAALLLIALVFFWLTK